MAETYATVSEYRTRTGDTTSDDERVEAMLADMSAELRAECGIAAGRALSDDAATLARRLVVDAVRKALVQPPLDGYLGDLAGASQASFTADGMTQSVTFSNASGSAYFDSRTLARLKRLLGRGQRIGMIWPYRAGFR